MVESRILTSDTFRNTIRNFASRHAQVRSFAKDIYFAEDGAEQYVGELKESRSFMIRYTKETEEIAESVSLAIVMRIQKQEIDTDWLRRITMKMHHEFPGTDELEFFFLPTKGGNLILLGSELIISREPTIQDLDSRFDVLCKTAPNVGAQFFEQHRVN